MQDTSAQVITNNVSLKLGVVIVTYNRLDLLKECLRACANQTAPFSKIIVVNNASTDGTTELIRANTQVATIALKENIGGSGGFYEGLKLASEETDLDYILLIDDDAILDSRYNEYILQYITKYNLAAASGTVITDGQIQTNHRCFIDSKYKGTDSQLNDYKKEFFDYDIATFCGLYISKQLIKEIGLPRADFFIWFDDIEYSLRINHHTKIRNINKAILTHKTSLQQRETCHWKTYYGVRNNYIMIQQHFPQKLPRYILKTSLKALYHYIRPTARDKAIAALYKDALLDAKHNKLGKNKKYNSKFILN